MEKNTGNLNLIYSILDRKHIPETFAQLNLSEQVSCTFESGQQEKVSANSMYNLRYAAQFAFNLFVNYQCFKRYQMKYRLFNQTCIVLSSENSLNKRN